MSESKPTPDQIKPSMSKSVVKRLQAQGAISDVAPAPESEVSERKGIPMANAEIVEDLAVSLAAAICDEDSYTRKAKRIQELLIEFADEIKRQVIEP